MKIKNRHRAVVLDVGGVITLPRDKDCFIELSREFGVSVDTLLAIMDKHRDPYDDGSIDPLEYWNRVLGELCALTTEAGLAGLDLQEAMSRYFEWGYAADYLAWSRPRTEIHDLAQEILADGGKLGIISNMPCTLDLHFVQTWPWLEQVGTAVYSGPAKMAKPGEAIFRHFMERSGWDGGDILFVDDREENALGARKAGMNSLHFKDPLQDIRTIRDWLGLS